MSILRLWIIRFNEISKKYIENQINGNYGFMISLESLRRDHKTGLVTDQILKGNNENDESTNFPSLKKIEKIFLSFFYSKRAFGYLTLFYSLF